MPTIAPIPDCAVTCRCGHSAELEAFALDTDRYACPACGWRWRVANAGAVTVNPHTGYVRFPERVLVGEQEPH